MQTSEKISRWFLGPSAKSDAGTERIRVVVLLDAVELPEIKGQSRPDDISWLQSTFIEDAGAADFEPERNLVSVPVVVGMVAPERVAELASHPYVVSIVPDLAMVPHRAEGKALMSIPSFVSQTGARGNGISVAIMDTGVDDSHPELAGQVIARGSFISPNSTDYSDGIGHGTAVAGIVAGKTSGVAPGARLWNAKVFDASGEGSLLNMMSALDTLYTQRSQFGGLHVINMSFGFPDAQYATDCDSDVPPVTAMMANFAAANILVVASAGNDAKASVSFPSCLSKVLAVGAVYDANIGPQTWMTDDGSSIRCSDSATSADRITCYSNSAMPLDVLAPAECANTTWRAGQQANCFGGTSAAAPYAAGVVALLKSARPSATVAEVTSALMSTGKPLTDVTNITRNRINASEAYAALIAPPCVAQQTARSCNTSASGSITTSDCRQSQGYRYEWLSLDVSAGQQISVTATSAAFRVYLYLTRPGPEYAVAAQSGTGSLTATADVSGKWWIQVFSWESDGRTGDYQISMTCSAAGACTTCSPNANTACLLGNRFKVTMSWKDYSANLSGVGKIISYAENKPQVDPTYGPLSEAAFFSMYSWASTSIETLVRMIKGQNINNRYWVFLTGFAGAEYTVTVQDTKTCQVWLRKVDAGATNMTKDFQAFPFP